MTDKDKTPEGLAETHCKALELAQGVDCSKFAWPPAYFTKEELREAFLAGYEAAKAEFLDKHYAIFYVDGVRYKVEKRGIVHSISNIQRIQTKEN